MRVVEYSIDEERVYVTGMSNGGFMTNRVACEMSDIIAAAAPVAGPLMEDYKGDKHPFGWNADPFKCKPKNRVPILHIHSSKDLVVPFEGVEGIDEALKPSFPDFASPFIDSLSSALALAVDTDFPSVHESMKKWCKINKVKGGNSFVSEKVDRSTVCKTWAKPEKKSKDNFAPVKLCVIDSPHPFGSGHCWPGKHLDWADLPREILAKLARSFFLSIKDKFKLLEEFFSDDIIGNPVGQCWNDKVNNEYIWDFFIQFRRKADGKLIMAGDINSEEL